jgi:DNA-binding MarR family transcriptional regulator
VVFFNLELRIATVPAPNLRIILRICAIVAFAQYLHGSQRMILPYAWCVEHTESKFALELLRLTRQCRGIDKYVAASAGLSVDEMHCVIALFTERPSSVTRLSELINVSPTRASKILKSLGQRGLVTRTLDPEDHRREVVILTPAGERGAGGIFSLVAEVGSELLGNWHRDLGANFSWLLETAARARKDGVSV